MIWVNTSGYTYLYPVYYRDDNTSLDTPVGNVTVDNLVEMICNYCEKYGTNKILLIGNEIQLQEFKKNIKEYNYLNYNNKEIEVYINNEILS